FADGDEDQALPQVHANFGKANVRKVEIRCATHFGRTAQHTIQAVGPAVIAAAKTFCALPIAARDRTSAMPAHIVKGANARLVAAYNQQGQAGDLGDYMIAHAGQRSEEHTS